MRKADGSIVELPLAMASPCSPASGSSRTRPAAADTAPPSSAILNGFCVMSAEGWISLGRARNVYGVALSGTAEDDDIELDRDATRTLRSLSGDQVAANSAAEPARSAARPAVAGQNSRSGDLR